jgi:CheY-like chemotaxis protein
MTKKILAIDDEPGVTRLIKLNLEKTGAYEVFAVNEPESALAAAREFKPDLILLDVMMPNMDGGDIASQFESDSDLKAVPIVFLTAIVTKQEAGPGGLRSSGKRFLAKPISLEELIHAIEETLRHSGQH